MSAMVKGRIDLAKADRGTATRAFAPREQPNYDAVCFHSREYMDKLMKALMIQAGIAPPRAHNLLFLKESLRGLYSSLRILRSLPEFLTRAGGAFRYPGSTAEEKDAAQCLAVCEGMKRGLLALLQQAEWMRMWVGWLPHVFIGIRMGLFKSAEERRIERDIKIRQGVRRIEKAIREQARFQDEFIRNAQQARRIGDNAQYAFIRNSLKKTATIRKLLERQMLAVKNALLIKRQAEASADFASAMALMAKEIGRLFGETDLLKTQADWEKAMVQSQTMEQRMNMFLDTIEEVAAQDVELSGAGEVVTDEEIDRLIEAEAEAEHQKELDRLASLRAELNSLKAEGEKQK